MVSLTLVIRAILEKSSAVAKMGDRLATTDMGRKVGAAMPLSVGELGPHLAQYVAWAEAYCTSVPSGILIHLTVWSQYTNFKLAVIVHRRLNGRAPLYLSDYCVPAAGADTRQQLRSNNRQLLAVPRYRLNTYGCRAFSVAGPTVWNSLPDFIRDPTISADCYRRLLKTYLFARY